jgi:multidrug efflux pump subunit AcrB
MWLTRLALRDPVLILMMSLTVMVLGWVSLRRLSVPNTPVRLDLLSAFGQFP